MSFNTVFEFTPRMKLELLDTPFRTPDFYPCLKFNVNFKKPTLTPVSYSLPLTVDKITIAGRGFICINDSNDYESIVLGSDRIGITKLLTEYFKQYKAPIPTDYIVPAALLNSSITSFLWQDPVTETVTVADLHDFQTTKTIVVKIIPLVEKKQDEIKVHLKFNSKANFALSVFPCLLSNIDYKYYSEEWIVSIFDKLDTEAIINIKQGVSHALIKTNVANSEVLVVKPGEILAVKPDEIKPDEILAVKPVETKPDDTKPNKFYKIDLETILEVTNYEYEPVGKIKFMRIEVTQGRPYEKLSECEYILDILTFSKGVQLGDSRDDEYLKILLDCYADFTSNIRYN